MKTIIAGSRGGIKYSHVAEAVNKCGWEITEIVSGCAAGADSLGEAYAKEKNIPVKKFPADWKNLSHPDAVIKTNKFGKYDALAGHRRNQQMADYAEALIACWDGISTGTKDMIERAKKDGLKVFVFIVDQF